MHPGNGEGDVLVRSDRPAEHVACLRVADGLFEAALGRPGAPGRERDPPLIKRLHEVGEPASALAQQVGFRHSHIGEGQRMGVRGVPADLVVGGLDDEPRRPGWDDDGREFLFDRPILTLGLAGHRRHGHQFRDLGSGVGDELLGPVDHPLAIRQHRGGLRACGIRTGIRLGQAEAREGFARGEHRQPLLPVGFGAAAVDRHDAETDPGRLRGGDALIDTPQLLDREAQREVVLALAAVLLGEREPEQTLSPVWAIISSGRRRSVSYW